jgi:hypothetical protein
MQYVARHPGIRWIDVKRFLKLVAVVFGYGIAADDDTDATSITKQTLIKAQKGDFTLFDNVDFNRYASNAAIAHTHDDKLERGWPAHLFGVLNSARQGALCGAHARAAA